MDFKAQKIMNDFLHICSEEMKAGNCNLTEAEASAIIDTFIKARRRELDPQSEAALLRRIADGYMDMADKIDHIKAEVADLKKGKVIRMQPRSSV